MESNGNKRGKSVRTLITSQITAAKIHCGSSLQFSFKGRLHCFFKNIKSPSGNQEYEFENCCYIYPNRCGYSYLPWEQGPHFHSNCEGGRQLWRFISAVCLQGTTHLWRERDIILQCVGWLADVMCHTAQRNSFSIDPSLQSQHCCKGVICVFPRSRQVCRLPDPDVHFWAQWGDVFIDAGDLNIVTRVQWFTEHEGMDKIYAFQMTTSVTTYVTSSHGG